MSKASQTSRPHSITFSQHSLTQQHSKDEVDINNIMKRYIKTGVIDHVAKYQGQYTENNETDYHTSMNMIIKADEMFFDLPSAVRKQFNNSPPEFLAFVSDKANHSKLQEMGLTNTPMSPPSDNLTPPPPVVKPTNTPKDPAAAATTATPPTASEAVQPL